VSRLYYVSHPEVAVDPDVPVPRWSLSDVGRQRALAMLEQPWLSRMTAIGSSPETKALEMAGIVGDHLSLDVEVINDSHEIDRSATGFVSHDRHEALADQLFAEPAQSAAGWERAIDAQHRAVEVFAPLLQADAQTHLVVGHGGIGTLLLCHLLDIEVDRSHDQPGQGHYWAFDCELQRVVHRWRPIDQIEPTIAVESPDTPDVIGLLESHLDLMRATSPPEHVHALEVKALMTPDITFFTARRNSELLGVGALRDLGGDRAEIKSMHTAAAARGQGVARFLLEHIIEVARSRSCTWVGLETGTMAEFAAARRLYESFGFTECEPFDGYTTNQFSVCMSLDL